MRALTSGDDGLDERRLEVLIRQGAGLRLQIVLTSAIVAAIAWGSASTPWVLAWMACAIGVREWRSIALLRLLNLPTMPIAQRIQRTVLWNALIGAVNGSAALFMLQLDTTHDALLTMVLVSWGAGGVSTGATIVPAFMAYGIGLFVPTAAMWLLSGNWLGLGVGTLVLMFFGVQLRYARRNCDTFEESYQMRQENLALASRLSEERSALAQARDAADAANQAKSQFLASASHDLRQPLQALALNGSELLRSADSPLVATLASEITRSIEDLRSMLDGLLDISNLDAGSVHVRSRNVDLHTLLEGIVASFRAAAAAKGLALEWRCEAGLVARTDPDLLRRILANLVDNALKFTPSGKIDLIGSSTPGGARLCVTDTGVGVAPADQERIFEVLVQLHNPERDHRRGYGLGLSIVRRLVKVLGIEMTLQSEAGAGSTFALLLPTAALPRAPAGAAGVDVQPLNIMGVRVLVLDDNAGVRSAYGHALTGHGCEVAMAATVDEALQAAALMQPDVAIVDYRLRGGEDGFVAIARLRAAQPTLGAMLCTAETAPQIATAAAAAGIKLLRKPLDGLTLAREIDAIRRAQRTLSSGVTLPRTLHAT